MCEHIDVTDLVSSGCVKDVCKEARKDRRLSVPCGGTIDMNQGSCLLREPKIQRRQTIGNSPDLEHTISTRSIARCKEQTTVEVESDAFNEAFVCFDRLLVNILSIIIEPIDMREA
jgi:hypothetical protein